MRDRQLLASCCVLCIYGIRYTGGTQYAYYVLASRGLNRFCVFFSFQIVFFSVFRSKHKSISHLDCDISGFNYLSKHFVWCSHQNLCFYFKWRQMECLKLFSLCSLMKDGKTYDFTVSVHIIPLKLILVYHCLLKIYQYTKQALMSTPTFGPVSILMLGFKTSTLCRRHLIQPKTARLV